MPTPILTKEAAVGVPAELAANISVADEIDATRIAGAGGANQQS